MSEKHKVSVILDAAEFDRLDGYCNRNGFKKSTLIARLIREHLDAERYGMQRDLPLVAGRRNGGNNKDGV